VLNLCANDVGTCTRRRSRSSISLHIYIWYTIYSIQRIPLCGGMCASFIARPTVSKHTHGTSVQLRCTNEMKYYVYVTSVHWPANKHTRTMAARLELPAGRRICQSYCCTRCTAQQAAPPPIFFMGITHMENGRELLLHRCRLHLPRGKLA